MTTTEVATLLGKQARTIQRQADAGILPTIGKLPGRTGAYLFDRALIEQLAKGEAALAEGGDAA
ncbi:helix-turn-helix protein [Microcella alkaliphila]|uniref:Helix-turn-helix protein n=1 Tax=Microcella alkaliphila TaxID=279828 RepID=A0A4V2FMY1_9MICO|nr:helix-turn-helix domain-containing protein [Microcella alkaliphila]RZT59359.1 helix-turn-helix protein [Microcella alkaliphila]